MRDLCISFWWLKKKKKRTSNPPSINATGWVSSVLPSTKKIPFWKIDLKSYEIKWNGNPPAATFNGHRPCIGDRILLRCMLHRQRICLSEFPSGSNRSLQLLTCDRFQIILSKLTAQNYKSIHYHCIISIINKKQNFFI